MVQPAPQLRNPVPMHAVHTFAVQRQLARLTIVGTRAVSNAQQLLQPLAQQPLLHKRIAHIGGAGAQRSREGSISRCTRSKQLRTSSSLPMLLRESAVCLCQLRRRPCVRCILLLQPLPLLLRPGQPRPQPVNFKPCDVVQLLHFRTSSSFNFTRQRHELVVTDVGLAV